jgi:hypothetical protein
MPAQVFEVLAADAAQGKAIVNAEGVAVCRAELVLRPFDAFRDAWAAAA